MRLEGSGPSKRNAKDLRRRMTPPEIGLWLALKAQGELRFRKQHGAGAYVLDFFCAPAMLAIEVTARRMRAVTGLNATPSEING